MASVAETLHTGRIHLGDQESITWEHLEDTAVLRIDNPARMPSEQLPSSGPGKRDVDMDSNASGDESRAYHVEDITNLDSTNIRLFKYSELGLAVASTSTTPSPSANPISLFPDEMPGSREHQTEPGSAVRFDIPQLVLSPASLSAGSTLTPNTVVTSPQIVPVIDDVIINEYIPTLISHSATRHVVIYEREVPEDEEESPNLSVVEIVSSAHGADGLPLLLDPPPVDRDVLPCPQRDLFTGSQLLTVGKMRRTISQSSPLP